MDVEATRLNAFTAGDIAPAMASLDFETDVEIIDIALSMIGLRAPDEARVIWMRSTLAVDVVACSEALGDEADLRDDIEVLTSPAPLPFDGEGNLPDFLPRSGW